MRSLDKLSAIILLLFSVLAIVVAFDQFGDCLESDSYQLDDELGRGLVSIIVAASIIYYVARTGYGGLFSNDTKELRRLESKKRLLREQLEIMELEKSLGNK